MHRFFISPEWIENRTVTLVDDVARQIRSVLRMQPGRKIVVLDNGGYEHYVTLRHVAKNVVTGEIYDSRPVESEPRLQLTLYQGTLKAQKFEWVLQKGTELGVTEFVPTICERSVLSDVENVDRKLERWARIIKEAAEQAGRGLLPKLRSARMFQQACQQAGQRAGVYVNRLGGGDQHRSQNRASSHPNRTDRNRSLYWPGGGLYSGRGSVGQRLRHHPGGAGEAYFAGRNRRAGWSSRHLLPVWGPGVNWATQT